MHCQIVDEFFMLVNSIKEEQRVSRDYGGNVLYHSEAELLDTIERNPEMNVSELSAYCGVTKSAITQISGKLCEKGILEKYTVGKNKKEKFLRLTENGKKTHAEFVKFHDEANANMRDYLCSLNEEDKTVILSFMEKMRANLPLCVFSCSCSEGCKCAG